MLIKLDDHYSKYTNGISEHEVCGDTIEQGMRELLNRYPQLCVHLMGDENAVSHSSLSINEEYVLDYNNTKAPLNPNDVIAFCRDIPTGEDSVFQAIAGVILMVVAVVVGVIAVITGQPWLMSGAAFLFKVGAGVLVSSVVTAIMEAFFTPDLSSATAPELLMNSASYTFEGAKNTTAIGTAIPIVYGTHRVGGHWLNIYTTVEDITDKVDGLDVTSNNSILFGQLGLSEGEVAGISDVMIDTLPVSYYNEVTTIPETDFYRLGLSEQSSMPSFNATMNAVAVGRKVINASQSIPQVNPTGGEFKPAYGYVDVPYGAWGERQNISVKYGLYQPVAYAISQTWG